MLRWNRLCGTCRLTKTMTRHTPYPVPPMLPFFGNVKPLLFESSVIPTLRPVPPPAATSEQMRKELDEVLRYTTNPTRERMRIVNFWADGVGTYTPPGHWNAIATEEFVKNRYREVRWARNYALLNAALMDAAILCWNTKFYYFNARPCQLDPRIKTLTGCLISRLMSPGIPLSAERRLLFWGTSSQKGQATLGQWHRRPLIPVCTGYSLPRRLPGRSGGWSESR